MACQVIAFGPLAQPDPTDMAQRRPDEPSQRDRPGHRTSGPAPMAPMRARRMRLTRASPDDAGWLHDWLDRIRRRFGSRMAADGMLTLQPWDGIGDVKSQQK